MSDVKILRKITARDVMELGKNKMPVPTEFTPLYVVYGVCTGLVAKPTQFDSDSYAIVGRFEAVRAKDHARFSSEQLYLPGDKHDYVVGLMQPNKDTGLIPEYQIAFNIGYGPDDKSAAGYVYTCSPVLDTKVQDALADTRKQVDAMLGKLLPAPAPKPAASGAPAGGVRRA